MEMIRSWFKIFQLLPHAVGSAKDAAYCESDIENLSFY